MRKVSGAVVRRMHPNTKDKEKCPLHAVVRLYYLFKVDDVVKGKLENYYGKGPLNNVLPDGHVLKNISFTKCCYIG